LPRFDLALLIGGQIKTREIRARLLIRRIFGATRHVARFVFCNAIDAISIAAATTLIPILLTMVTDQTGIVLELFNRYHPKSDTDWDNKWARQSPRTLRSAE